MNQEMVVYRYYLEKDGGQNRKITQRVEKHWTEELNEMGGKEAVNIDLY